MVYRNKMSRNALLSGIGGGHTGGFPGGPVVIRPLCFHCREPGFDL